MRVFFAIVAAILFGALFCAALFDHSFTVKVHDLLFYAGLASTALALIPFDDIVRYRERRY